MVTSQHLAKLFSCFALPVALAALAFSAPSAKAAVVEVITQPGGVLVATPIAVNYAGEVLAQLNLLPPTGDTVANATPDALFAAFNKAVAATATSKASADLYVTAVLAARADRNTVFTTGTLASSTIAAQLVKNAVISSAGTLNAAAITKISAAALSGSAATTASLVGASVTFQAFKFAGVTSGTAAAGTFIKSLVLGLPVAQNTDAAKAQLAKGAVNALVATPLNVGAVVASMLTTNITLSSANLNLFAVTALSGSAANINSSIAGVVAKAVAPKLTTDALRASMAAAVINSMGATVKITAATSVSTEVSKTIALTTNQAIFGGALVKLVPTYAVQVTGGVMAGYSTALTAAQKETAKGQLAKEVVQALVAAPTSVPAVVNAILTSGTFANKNAFAVAALSGSTANINAAIAGAVTKAVATTILTGTTGATVEGVKASLAAAVINATGISARAALANTIASEISKTIVLTTGRGVFAGGLVKLLPLYISQVTTGVIVGLPVGLTLEAAKGQVAKEVVQALVANPTGVTTAVNAILTSGTLANKNAFAVAALSGSSANINATVAGAVTKAVAASILTGTTGATIEGVKASLAAAVINATGAAARVALATTITTEVTKTIALSAGQAAFAGNLVKLLPLYISQVTTGVIAGLPVGLTLEAAKGQVAKEVVQALVANPTGVTTAVNVILASGTLTNLNAFAIAALSGSSSNVNSTIAGTVAKLIGVKLSTDALKASLVSSIVNSMGASAKISAASLVTQQMATLVLAANHATFARTLAGQIPTYSDQIAKGVSIADPANAVSITTQVMLGSAPASAAAIAGAVAGSVASTTASFIAQSIGNTFATVSGSNYITQAPAIARAIANSLANVNVETDINKLAQQIGDVAAILGAKLPANNSAVMLDIASAVASIAPRASFNLTDYYSKVAGYMAEAVQKSGGSDTLIDGIQAKFFALIADATIRAAISNAISLVKANVDETTYKPYITPTETPFFNH